MITAMDGRHGELRRPRSGKTYFALGALADAHLAELMGGPEVITNISMSALQPGIYVKVYKFPPGPTGERGQLEGIAQLLSKGPRGTAHEYFGMECPKGWEDWMVRFSDGTDKYRFVSAAHIVTEGLA